MQLADFLRELEQRYAVRFNYESEVVKDKVVPKSDLVVSRQNLYRQLNKVLGDLDLSLKEIKTGYFLIAKQSSAQIPKPTPAKSQSALEPEVLPHSQSTPNLPTPSTLQQLEIRVSGKVTDESNEPLPGVNILGKGTTVGTVTDAEGTFQLSLPDQVSTLVFSSIGYSTKEVAINGQSVINVVLAPDNRSLDEVVVVGYGQQSKRNVTGSIAKVEMSKFENYPNTNVTQALRGTIAGVQFTENGRPGQGGNILVRGQRSISAGNGPLIVLDGIFFNGSLNDINPNDISSMEVLKDASAAAIYGSRAANGVILITSKKGTSDKPTVRFNTFQGVSGWSYRPKLLTPERYIQKTLDYEWQFRRTPQRPDISQLENLLTPPERVNYANGHTLDPWDVVAQQGRMQSYDLSIAGNSKGTNYFISGNYTLEKGIIFNDNARRISLRANIETKVADWFAVGMNAQFSDRDMSKVPANIREAYWLSPYAQLFYEDGDPVPYPVDDQLVSSPIRGALLNRNEQGSQNLFANLYGKIDLPFIEGLSYRINYSPNFRWGRNYNFSPIYQRYGLNNLGSASKENTSNFDWVLENILSYTKSLGQNHEFDVTALYGRNATNYNRTSAAGSDFTAFTDVNGWNNLSVAQVYNVESNATQVEGVSAMLRLNYRFKNRYLFTLTARRDGSSVFSENHKYATMPSAAIAWIASEEKFLQSSPFDLLKFRLSYGAVGNQAISPYQTLVRGSTLRYVFGDGSPTYTGGFISGIGNNNLKWETTYSTNLAVDFEMLRGRLGGTLEAYNMNTKDLILSKTLPSAMGFNSILENVGEVNNKGLEITLNTVNVRSGKFEWSSNVVFSTNRNRIVHLTGEDANKDGIEDDNLTNRWFIGQPIRVAFDYVLDGIYQVGDDDIPTGQRPGWHRIQDVSGNGTIGPEDRVVFGQYEPKYRWGFTNMFRYGPFSLSVFVNAMQGWIQQFNLLAVNNTGGSGNFPGRPANFLDSGWWTEDNPSDTRPSLDYVNATGHNYYASRDFIRIQDVSLAYEVPKSLLNRIKVGGLRLYVSGKNVATFTDFPGFDPESGYATSGTTGAWPSQRTLVGGLNLTF
ncbi:TonB-dependent receptor [Rhabdobacter roseus]